MTGRKPSVQALCASADTAPGTMPAGPAPARLAWDAAGDLHFCNRPSALAVRDRGAGDRPNIGDCVVLFKFKVVVKDDERAFLVRDGRFERSITVRFSFQYSPAEGFGHGRP